MDATEFVRKWAATTGKERATSQEHFIDLCRLLNEQTPNEADPTGDRYAFEKGAKGKDADGFADVWMHQHFAWEYKGKHRDLDIAYTQVLQKYREQLGNPPLLVVSDIERYEVHTNWTNTESWIYKFRSADIVNDDPVEVVTIAGQPPRNPPGISARKLLKAIFEDPNALRPDKTRDEITREAAGYFEHVAKALRDLGTPNMEIAHFITRLVFCMFASDVGLLPRGTFSEVVSANNPDNLRKNRPGDTSDPAPTFRRHLSVLFEKMRTGGEMHVWEVPYFNGSLFDDASVPDGLTANDIRIIEMLDNLNWANVEPSIFGTLFERILDKENQRAALGAHYTLRADIELIVEPVLMDPLRRDWNDVKARVAEIDEPRSGRRRSEAVRTEKIKTLLRDFHKRLCVVRVLDPACGSGNFLYVALAAMKGLEKEILALAQWHGITIRPRVHPRQLYGIELNEYAQQLASIVIWIGYLQWKNENDPRSLRADSPILEDLKQIEFKDAILDTGVPDRPREPAWPEVDVIVGNPPFLGGKRLRTELGDQYVERMFAVYEGRVARESDLVCYWFEKARAEIKAGRAKRAGLLATQAIRGGANRKTLERIKQTGDIFYAQSDRRWILEGAAVRVSMVGFDDGSEVNRKLNIAIDDDPAHALLGALPVPEINANLTGSVADVTEAKRLKENLGISFMGTTKIGKFEIGASDARKLLAEHNPNGRPNSDVVRPWVNGSDVTGRPRGYWIIDYPPGTSEIEAAKYEKPFELLVRAVKTERLSNARKTYRDHWWIHGEARPDMRLALAGLTRYIVTPRISKHRVFVWVEKPVLPDSATFVFARMDDYFFGVLHSRVHETWALLQGTQLENRPRYTPTSCFETFPFPRATKEQQRAIWLAARDLDGQRQNWLNPDGMIGARELAKRTLTDLYNARPTWLANAHRTLDEAVFAAYGWREAPEDLPDVEIVARLLALNLTREPA